MDVFAGSLNVIASLLAKNGQETFELFQSNPDTLLDIITYNAEFFMRWALKPEFTEMALQLLDDNKDKLLEVIREYPMEKIAQFVTVLIEVANAISRQYAPKFGTDLNQALTEIRSLGHTMVMPKPIQYIVTELMEIHPQIAKDVMMTKDLVTSSCLTAHISGHWEKRLNDFASKAEAGSSAEGNASGASGLPQFSSVLDTMEQRNFRWEDKQTVEIQKFVCKLLGDVIDKLARKDPIFRDLVHEKVGSFWSGTRVGRYACEFDHLFVLAGECEAGHAFTVAKVNGVCCLQVRRSFSDLPHWHAATYNNKQLLKSDYGGKYVDPGLLWEYFADCLDGIMEEVQLEDGYTHGGFLAPRFSGMRLNRPAATISIIRHDVPVPITIDMALGVEVSLRDLDLPRDVKLTIEETRTRIGLEGPPVIYMVPGPTKAWLLTTSVLETQLLQHLCETAPEMIQLHRDVKTLCSHVLDWSPTDEMTSNVSRILIELQRGDPDPESELPGIPTEDLHDCVVTSINNGRLGKPEPLPEAIPELTNFNRRCLVAHAVRCIHEQNAVEGLTQQQLDGEEHDPKTCSLCQDLAKFSKALEPTRLHPAVAAAVGEPVRSWAGVQSCYIKYMVLNDVLERRAHAQTRERQLEMYLERILDAGREKYSRGVPIQHPFLKAEVKGIAPFTWNTSYTSADLWSNYKSLLQKLTDLFIFGHI